MQQTIASFDLGIKNLSYAVATFDISGTLLAIPRWANLNLLADGADSQTQTRCPCGGPASYTDVGVRLYCKKCAKKSQKPPIELAATAKLAEWKAWSKGTGGTTTAAITTKAAIMNAAAAIRLLHYKPPKAKGVSLQDLLASMERCLSAELPWLAHAQRIRIENQPAEFAPHMKSIQIMLFTLIDHRLRTEYDWKGSIEFVNASVKTRGTTAGTGKDAKKSRKDAGIQRVSAILDARVAEQAAWWRAQAKRDDLADALLMCVDGVLV